MARSQRLAASFRFTLSSLNEILFQVMEHIQDIWISLITGKPATALRKFSHYLRLCHGTPLFTTESMPPLSIWFHVRADI
jgi:hypothetical protein